MATRCTPPSTDSSLPCIKAPEVSHPFRGQYRSEGKLKLAPFSCLILRLPDYGVLAFLPLAGKALDPDGRCFRIGIPESRGLRPAATLYARLVTIQESMESTPVPVAAMRQFQKGG